MHHHQLFELEDKPWLPVPIRDAATDYLRFLIELVRPYHAVVDHLDEALRHCGEVQIIDLCSGGGGPWLGLQGALQARGLSVQVCLTDRYPNLEAWQRLQQLSQGLINFVVESVDAQQVPPYLKGFRTIFSSFHHFSPDEALAILQNAVDQHEGIAIFEAVQRHPWVILLACLNPFIVLLLTPFIRPFRWSRLFWTYVIPAVPFVVLFDGIISFLRSYAVTELQELSRKLSGSKFYWDTGTARGGLLPVTYLIGYPAEASNKTAP